MSLRKEEERKQMHNKTGGGVFNLIFKRGKSSMGSGSVSSENRSISPAHSDDSRSVTPPAIQPPPIVTLPKKDPPERPKPPQRKRRPAPKPPQIQVSVTSGIHSTDNNTTAGKELAQEPPNKKTSENGLTICHSRNSSDSSGYHEASILSDHCANASLPRSRPKSAFVGGDVSLQTTSNLSKMSVHSRSTTSLITGRRKKAAPPPPPLAISPASSVISQSEKPSPLVASQSDSTINTGKTLFSKATLSTNTRCTEQSNLPKKKNAKQMLTEPFQMIRNALRNKTRVYCPATNMITTTTTLGNIYREENLNIQYFYEGKRKSSDDVPQMQQISESDSEQAIINEILSRNIDEKLLKAYESVNYLDDEHNEVVNDACSLSSNESIIEKRVNIQGNKNDKDSSKVTNSNENSSNEYIAQIISTTKNQNKSNRKVANIILTKSNSLDESTMSKSDDTKTNEAYPVKDLLNDAIVLANYNISPSKNARKRFGSTRKLTKQSPRHSKNNSLSNLFNKKEKKNSREASPEQLMIRNPDDVEWREFISKLDKIMISKNNEFI
ncbi:hypothetical protein GWI33_007178 [Rhynchophorus ferrugineus]|uniref:Uncharacterized protein n=1 Tax=Rhynchophorus ferrugineus TaxID=354439 RepID=A0A834IHZ4_RHYFE|nr:hypothetical protein GWI33_007178 [Rhynchophorus ferrugineus]